MSAPPGQRRARADETRAPDNALGSAPILNHDDTVPLKYGLAAVYVRDDDVLSVARRRFLRCHRQLTGPQLIAYEAWLAQQRRDAS